MYNSTALHKLSLYRKPDVGTIVAAILKKPEPPEALIRVLTSWYGYIVIFSVTACIFLLSKHCIVFAWHTPSWMVFVTVRSGGFIRKLGQAANGIADPNI